MARKGAWWLSVSTTTATPVASQPVHQLRSLCFICKRLFTRAVGHSWQRVLRSYRSSSPVTYLRRAVMAQECNDCHVLLLTASIGDMLHTEISMFIMG